jgi:hypothetical protein
MRSLSAFAVLSLFAVGCDTSSTPTPNPDLSVVSSQADLANGQPTLTVNNTLRWCTVTVTVGAAAPVMFATESKDFQAAAGTVVMLSATPNPGFTQVKWTGVTTMSGASATYLMTSGATQMITACCPFTNGTGC